MLVVFNNLILRTYAASLFQSSILDEHIYNIFSVIKSSAGELSFCFLKHGMTGLALGKASSSSNANIRIVYVFMRLGMLTFVVLISAALGTLWLVTLRSFARVSEICNMGSPCYTYFVYSCDMLAKPSDLHASCFPSFSLSCGSQYCQYLALRSSYLFGRWCRHSKDHGNRMAGGIRRILD